jgi:hypothetical protein
VALAIRGIAHDGSVEYFKLAKKTVAHLGDGAVTNGQHLCVRPGPHGLLGLPLKAA